MRTILILILFFSTSSVLPHQDTIIELKKNGTLVGLPEKYSPASFSTSNLILEIAEKKIKIPDCVTSYFTEMDDPTFSFTASWYHSKPNLPGYEPLPDYMSMIVSSSVDNPSNVQVLFNLETLAVFEINILQENITVNGIDYSLFYDEQPISKNCKKELLNSVYKK
jgi:hypothetical protein